MAGTWEARGSGAWGLESHTWGGSCEPQRSGLLLSVSSRTEGRGTWLPGPKATLSSPQS